MQLCDRSTVYINGYYYNTPAIVPRTSGVQCNSIRRICPLKCKTFTQTYRTSNCTQTGLPFLPPRQATLPWGMTKTVAQAPHHTPQPMFQVKITQSLAQAPSHITRASFQVHHMLCRKQSTPTRSRIGFQRSPIRCPCIGCQAFGTTVAFIKHMPRPYGSEALRLLHSYFGCLYFGKTHRIYGVYIAADPALQPIDRVYKRVLLQYSINCTPN
jgi:hypothetical protein